VLVGDETTVKNGGRLELSSLHVYIILLCVDIQM
jgi:hypothetical protein